MNGTLDNFISLLIMVVLKAVVQYDNVIIGAIFFSTQILRVCVSSECLFISGLQSLPEVYYIR